MSFIMLDFQWVVICSHRWCPLCTALKANVTNHTFVFHMHASVHVGTLGTQHTSNRGSQCVITGISYPTCDGLCMFLFYLDSAGFTLTLV